MVLRMLPEGYTFQAQDDLDVPITIAWGEKDRLLLPYQAGRARRELPLARHRWLPDCGHVPMPDDPELIVDVIVAGTRELAPSARAQRLAHR